MSVSSTGARMLPEPEDPGILAANLRVGVRLLVSAIAFLFVAFVFAFFYLKAVNSNDNWRPAGVSPSQGYGIAVLVCVLATALFFELGRRGLAVAAWSRWRAGLAVALVFSIAVVVLDLLVLTTTGFGSTGGGYASVFYGWTALWLGIWLGAFYWVETLLAGTLRGTTASEHVSGEPRELLGPSAVACVVYLYAMSGIALVTYVLLYLIK